MHYFQCNFGVFGLKNGMLKMVAVWSDETLSLMPS